MAVILGALSHRLFQVCFYTFMMRKVLCAHFLSYSKTLSSPASCGLTFEGKDGLRCARANVQGYMGKEQGAAEEATIFRSLSPRFVTVIINLIANLTGFSITLKMQLRECPWDVSRKV